MDFCDAHGFAKFRERTAVEYTLVRLGLWQGRHCRYRGQRMARFDAHRGAAVHNLHVAMHHRRVNVA